jgi:four helix bundle protein
VAGEVERTPTFNIQHSTLNFQLKNETKNGEYDLEERLLEYSAQIVRIVDRLPRTPAGSHVGVQLLRSGTSPLPNHGEAQAAESTKDFVHKMRICLKELRETRRWLRLAMRVPLVNPPSQFEPLLDETEELIKIFYASIRTADKGKS